MIAGCSRQLLPDLGLVGGTNAKLLIRIELDMLAPLDNNGAHSECGTHAGTDRCTHGAARDSTDRYAGTGRGTDLNCIALIGTLADRHAFVIHLLNVVALNRQDFGQHRVKIAPAAFVQDDPIEREVNL